MARGVVALSVWVLFGMPAMAVAQDGHRVSEGAERSAMPHQAPAVPHQAPAMPQEAAPIQHQAPAIQHQAPATQHPTPVPHQAPRAVPDHRRIEPWHGDIRRFHQHDFPAWRAGRWFHGPHGGRDGWWWIVGLNWYWYPQPIYPYPDPYLPPPAVVISPPQDEAVQPQYWYYCADPPGYYPYVPQCYGNWERVPTTPP